MISVLASGGVSIGFGKAAAACEVV